MKTFLEYLMESETKHKAGTYAKLELDGKSRDHLYNWLKKKGIKDLLEPSEYHVTIAYSREPVPQISKIEVELPIKVKAIGWEIFGELLVLKLSPKLLKPIWQECRDMGATWDYDEFIPHISVAKTKIKPHDYPSLPIVLTEYDVSALDEDFSYD